MLRTRREVKMIGTQNDAALPSPLPHLGRYQRSLLDKDTFSITWELVPGRGAFEKAQEAVALAAEQAARGGKVHALTITDNPGGTPALAAELLGVEINRLGIEPLVHLTCKDKNRSELESLLYGLERASVRNLLIMTGDYPKAGYLGAPKPAFDLDPVTLLGLVSDLNRGREVPTMKGSTTLKPAHFFAGAVASPFKSIEAEQMGQYYKLQKKLHAGAQFIVSQLGFDARKFHELLQMVRLLGFGHVPLVGNVYVLPAGAARLMNSKGLPGCVVPDKLLAQVQQEATASDKGRAARFQRAAEMYAIFKGLGFAGVHIAGHAMTYPELESVIAQGEELVPEWQNLVPKFDNPQPNGWYFFQRDEKTGLNTAEPTDRGPRPSSGITYKIFRTMHHAMFTRKGIFFPPMRALSKVLDGSPLEGAFTKFENVVKGITNDCRHCGDCAMFDTGYLCPQSQCPKSQRNGPCGGSTDGWCEKYPGQRKCVYVRAYTLLKSHGAEDSLAASVTPPINYELQQTSSWMNFYLGRDHSAEPQGITKVEPKHKTRD